MKQLILILTFFLVTPMFSQQNINQEFCKYLVKKHSLDSDLNFDTTTVKIVIDSLKKYVVQNKSLVLPTYCYNYDFKLFGLDDYVSCYTGSYITIGKLAYIHFPIDEEENQEFIFSKFNDFISEYINVEYLTQAKVYCDIFKFEHEYITSTIYNPNDFSITDIKEKTNNYFIFFIYFL